MKGTILRRMADCKRRIQQRLRRKNILVKRERPVFNADGIHYQLTGRTREITAPAWTRSRTSGPRHSGSSKPNRR